jgi:hypothetical protein
MSKDADIMDALKTRLQTILVTGGYQTNIGQKVHIWRTTPLGPEDVPAIMADDTDIEHNNGAVMGMTRNTMSVDMVVVLTGSASLSDARKARADLKKCLHGYETMGGLVSRMSVEKTAIEMKQFENLIAGAKARLTIEYDTPRGEI